MRADPSESTMAQHRNDPLESLVMLFKRLKAKTRPSTRIPPYRPLNSIVSVLSYGRNQSTILFGYDGNSFAKHISCNGLAFFFWLGDGIVSLCLIEIERIRK